MVSGRTQLGRGDEGGATDVEAGVPKVTVTDLGV